MYGIITHLAASDAGILQPHAMPVPHGSHQSQPVKLKQLITVTKS